MTIRTLLAPVMVFGLAGAAIYYAPCLSGDCGEAAAVAEGEGDATPCDTPCPGKADKAKAQAAEPAPEALAAVEEEDPCPYSRGEEPCDGKKGADAPDASALAAAEPTPKAAPEQGASPEPKEPKS